MPRRGSSLGTRSLPTAPCAAAVSATAWIAAPPGPCTNALIALRSCLALDTNLSGAHCLTHIGREGSSVPFQGAPEDATRPNRQGVGQSPLKSLGTSEASRDRKLRGA